MGLDQYAYIKIGSAPEGLDEDEKDKYEYENCTINIAYWRKHPNLQGWMERCWRTKNNSLNEYEADTHMNDCFNCVELELTLEDIQKLEKDVKNNNLNGGLGDTTGFFFGDTRDEEFKYDDLKFCKNARVAIQNGLKVIYYSWW